ncbi:MAG: inositol monophosphatase family protein [Deltaproteobacteria bacterium]
MDELVRTAIEAALAGGREALARFRGPDLGTRPKADGSPVTEGDLASEAAALRVLRARHPGHAILTEESGELPGDAAHRWYLDPVDGTRSYCRGIRSWATLVALAIDGEPEVGVIYAPALDQLAVAWKGGGAGLNGSPIRVSERATLAEATLSIGSLDLLPGLPWGERAFHLMSQAFACRGFSDAIGHIEVARGAVDGMIDPRGKSWDFAPVAILLREAGGRFSSLSGGTGFDEGNALVSNGRLHDALLAALGTAAKER